MDNKSVIQTFFALMVCAVIFFIGFYFSAAIQLFESTANPRIESETEARNCIHSKFNLELSDNATHLYYAGRGFVDTDYYAAFSLPNAEECEIFIEKQLDVKLEDFKEITELPEDIFEYGPGTWEREYQDPVWDLKRADKYLLCTNSYIRVILYAPEKHRFYFRLH